MEEGYQVTGRRPGELLARESALRTAFLQEIDRIPGGDRLLRCIQCGTCSGSCPVSYAMDIQPRQLVGFFRSGDIEPILKSRTIWLCASCYSCTVRCPSGIKITDLIYGLKRIALDRKIHHRRLPTFALSRNFTWLVRRYGRNQEIKLIALYFLRIAPWRLLGMIPLGWAMLRKGRFPWRTHKVKGIQGLRKIIAKAEQMEHRYPSEAVEPVGSIGYGAVTERPTDGQRGAA
jgi:heterodisulfide reductase subunit C